MELWGPCDRRVGMIPHRRTPYQRAILCIDGMNCRTKVTHVKHWIVMSRQLAKRQTAANFGTR